MQVEVCRITSTSVSVLRSEMAAAVAAQCTCRIRNAEHLPVCAVADPFLEKNASIQLHVPARTRTPYRERAVLLHSSCLELQCFAGEYQAFPSNQLVSRLNVLHFLAQLTMWHCCGNLEPVI